MVSEEPEGRVNMPPAWMEGVEEPWRRREGGEGGGAAEEREVKAAMAARRVSFIAMGLWEKGGRKEHLRSFVS